MQMAVCCSISIVGTKQYKTASFRVQTFEKNEYIMLHENLKAATLESFFFL